MWWVAGPGVAGHRVLLFCQMTRAMDLVQDALRAAAIPHLRLDGSTKTDARAGMLRVPPLPARNRVLLCQIRRRWRPPVEAAETHTGWLHMQPLQGCEHALFGGAQNSASWGHLS